MSQERMRKLLTSESARKLVSNTAQRLALLLFLCLLTPFSALAGETADADLLTPLTAEIEIVPTQAPDPVTVDESGLLDELASSEEPVIPSEGPVVTPSEEPVVPLEEPAISSEEPVAPSEEPAIPSEEPVIPSEEPIVPSEEPVVPSEEPVVPSEEPVIPSEEPVIPSEEPVAPLEEEPVAPLEEEPVAPSDESVIAVSSAEPVPIENSVQESNALPNEEVSLLSAPVVQSVDAPLDDDAASPVPLALSSAPAPLALSLAAEAPLSQSPASGTDQEDTDQIGAQDVDLENGDETTDDGGVNFEGLTLEDSGATLPVDVPGDVLYTTQETEPIPGGQTVTVTNALQNAVSTLNNTIGTALETTTIGDTTLDKAKAIIYIDPGVYTGDVTIKDKFNFNHQEITVGQMDLVIALRDSITLQPDGAITYTPAKQKDSVKINGNVHVTGNVNLSLYGIFLALDKAFSNSDANLTINGTSENDAITVNSYASEGKTVSTIVNGMDGNDTLRLTAGDSSKGIVHQTADGGNGNDTITAENKSVKGGDVTVNGGEGDNVISVTTDTAENVTRNITVTSGSGNDKVTTKQTGKGTSRLKIMTGAGNDEIIAAITSGKDCTFDVQLGDGDDKITLDTSLVQSIKTENGIAQISVDAGAGIDTVHLTGKLSPDAGSISGAKTKLTLKNSDNKLLAINLSNAEIFTDALENKPKITLSGVDKDGFYLDGARTNRVTSFAPFTSYEYGSNENIILPNLQSLPLSNALLTTLSISSKKALTVGSLNLGGVALELSGAQITVKGDVRADSIYIRALDSDTAYKTRVNNSALKGLSVGTGAAGSDGVISGSFFKVETNAAIVIESGAKLTASKFGAVELTARSEQTHGLVELFKLMNQVNFINFKIGSSSIDILGQISGGRIAARAETTADLLATSEHASSLCVPLSVGMGFMESSVNVHGSAALTAETDVSLAAASNTKIDTKATTGVLPVSIAFSMAFNDAHLLVTDSARISAGRNVSLSAGGKTTVSTVSQKGEFDSGNSGGYFAVSVVLQDVSAKVEGAAGVRAGGNVTVLSNATENVVTKATSAKVENENNVDEFSLDSILTYLRKLGLTAAQEALNDKVKDKVITANKKLNSDTGAHSVSSGTTENGVLAVSSTRANAGDAVVITLTPNAGYKADTVKATYLAPGAKERSSLTLTKVNENRYSFVMPAADVSLEAAFVKGTSPQTNNNEQQKKGIGEIINDATNGAKNSHPNRATANSADANAKKITLQNPDNAGGAILTDVQKVVAGKEVLVTVNPMNNYKLSALSVRYTVKENGVDVKKSDEITVNDEGEYVFTMPASDVTLEAAFEVGTDKTAQKKKQGTTSLQMTGALAVAVTDSANAAKINTTGSVISGGKLKVSAEGETVSEATADATSCKPGADPEEKKATDDLISFPQKISDTLGVAEIKNGTVALENQEQKDGYEQYAFTVTPRLGSTLQAITCKYVNANGETRVFQLKKDGDSYLFPYGREYDADGNLVSPVYPLKSGSGYTIEATFKTEGDGVTVTPVTAEGGTVTVSKPKAKAGDAVVLTVKAASGYSLKGAVKVVYADDESKTVALTDIDGKLTFTMPEAMVKVVAAFEGKTHKVSVSVKNAQGQNVSTDENVSSFDHRLDDAETFHLALSAKALSDGLSVKQNAAQSIRVILRETEELTGDDTGDTREFSFDILNFKLPTCDEFAHFRAEVVVTLINSAFAVEGFTQMDDKNAQIGTITGPKRANAGDKITLTVTPASGYALSDAVTVKTTLADGAISTGKAVKISNTSYEYTLPKALAEGAKISLSGAFAAGTTPAKDKKVSIGVGIAAAVTFRENTAIIESGTISAKGVAVSAESKKLNAAANAKAGYSDGDIGVGGAIAVNVASGKTDASIAKNAALTVGSGDIKLNAESGERFVTNADASGKGKSAKVGVGAGVAVGVFGVDTRAALEDGLKVTCSAPQTGALEIKVKHKLSETIGSKAGAKGGIAVTPVLSLLISGTSAEAYLGSISPLNLSGDAAIETDNELTREAAANAAAAGGKVGVGASFVITILNDTADALVKASLDAKNVKVHTTSKSTVKSISRAGASGEDPQKGSSSDSADAKGGADKQADKAAGAGGKVAGNVNTKNTSVSSVSQATGDRQKAETSEGSVQVAAGFVLNLQNHFATSAIMDNLTITAIKNVTVLTETKLSSAAEANASATKAKNGVGVAVALNIVNYTSEAFIGASSVTAEGLVLQAKVIEAKIVTKQDAKLQKAENYIVAFVKDQLNQLIDKILGDSAMAAYKDMIKAAVGVIVNGVLGESGENLVALLKDTGLEGLVKDNPVLTLQKNVSQIVADYDELTRLGFSTEMWKKVYKSLQEHLLPSLQQYAVETLLNSSIKKGGEADGVKNQIKAAGLNVYHELKDEITKVVPVTAKSAEYWETLFGNIGMECASALTRGIADIYQVKKFIMGNAGETLKKNLKTVVSNAGTALTSAAINAITDQLNVKLKPEEAPNAHMFTTTAIAGAGASNVGVAGSVAITLVSGVTRAYLSDTTDAQRTAVTIKKDALIESVGYHAIETTATSSVTQSGDPDKNEEAEKENGDAGDGGSAGKKYDYPDYALEDGTNIHLNATSNGKADIKYQGGKLVITLSPDEGYQYKADSIAVAGLTAAQKKKITVSGNVITIPEFTKGATLGVALSFAEMLRTIDPGAISAEHGEASISSTKAKHGDSVAITFTPSAGYTAKNTAPTITYTYTVNGQEQTKNVVSSQHNSDGTLTYLFYMPDADVKLRITNVTFSPEVKEEEEEPKNSAGNAVGVGAAFAMTYNTLTSESSIGKNRIVTAGTLWVNAEGSHEVDNVSVSGTDPISTDEDEQGDPMATAIDASASLNLTFNHVKALIASGAQIKTTGEDTLNLNKTKYADPTAAKINADLVNFALTSTDYSYSGTRASGFSAGGKTAVGAAVAINIIEGTAETSFMGSGTVSGTARVGAYSESEDDSLAMATAIGADIQRYCEKFKSKAGSVSASAENITNGKYFDDESKKKTNTNNGTATKINNTLDKNKGTGSDAKKASNEAPLSSNAVRSQGAKTDSRADGTVNKGLDSANSSGIGDLSKKTSDSESTYQVAAAVSLNITNHAALAHMMGNLTAGSIEVQSENLGNFRTVATGIAMSLAKSSNAIAAGVSVSVNRNRSIADVADGLTLIASEDDEESHISIEASTEQNVNGNYKHYLAGQSIAGAVSGTGGKATIAGAVTIVVSGAQTKAIVGENVKLLNGDISVTAKDKTKLAVRSGAVSISRGTACGVGASFALIYAENAVLAEVKKGVSAKGASFELTAQKLPVTFSDYDSGLSWKLLLTDSTDLTDEQRANSDQLGIIDVYRKKDKDGKLSSGYSVDIHISTDTVMRAIDLMNFLSSVNYYAEAIAGAVTTGADTKVTVGGSVAMVLFNNTVEAVLGDNAVIEVSGDAAVTASSKTNLRLIAGALSAGPSKVGVGASIGFVLNNDSILASVGKNVTITAGSYAQKALNDADHLIVTAAMAVASSAAVGGNITALSAANTVRNAIGEGTKIYTRLSGDAPDGAVSNIVIDTASVMDLILISASVSASKGPAAIGGTIAVIVNDEKAYTDIAGNVSLTADQGSVLIASRAETEMLNVLCSASASLGTAGVAGAVGVLIDGGDVRLLIADNTKIYAANDVSLTAENESKLLSISAGLAYGSTVGIGATVQFSKLSHTTAVRIGTAQITAVKGNIVISSISGERALILGVAAGASSTVALAGTPVIVITGSAVTVVVGRGSKLTAGDSIAIFSDYNGETYIIAGALAVSGTVGVGAAISVATHQNTVTADVMENAILTAQCLGNGLTGVGREEKRRGIYIGATAYEKMVFATVSGAAAGTAGVSGVVHTLVLQNTVRAKVASGVQLAASGAAREVETKSGEKKTLTADITVEASDDSHIIDCAGGLAFGGTAGVGVTVVALVYKKNVSADAYSLLRAAASGNILISAKASDELFLLALTFAAGGVVGVSGGANALIFSDSVSASLGGQVNAGGNIDVLADSGAKLYNVAASGGAAGAVGVSAVAVITFFTGDTIARVAKGAALTGADVAIKATSKEFVTADAAGVAVGGAVGVGGTLDLIRFRLVTKAFTEADVRILSSGDVLVSASDDYEILAIVVTIGAAGVAAVGVTALVNISSSTVSAYIGAGSVIRAHNVTVQAASARKTQSYVATLAAAGVAGVGVNVSVVLVGARMTEDAHDSLYVKGGIDPAAQLDFIFSPSDDFAIGKVNKTALSGLKPEDDLSALLAGDGQAAKDQSGNYGSFGQGKDDFADADHSSATANAAQGPFFTPVAQTGHRDATSALVDGGVSITVNGDILISAHDSLYSDSIGGSVAVGGVAGVGASVSVTVLYGSVVAKVQKDAALAAEGAITITAVAGSPVQDIDNTPYDADAATPNGARANAASSATNGKLGDDVSFLKNITTSTIRQIAVTGAGGLVGVGVTAGVLLVYTEVEAALCGHITKAQVLSIDAQMNYGTPVTLSIAAGIGLVSVSASYGMAYYSGRLTAAVVADASIENVSNMAYVRASGITNADAAAAALAAGAVGVAAGMAYAINETETLCYVDGGAIVHIPSAALSLSASLTSSAHALIISTSIGLVGASAAIALSINRSDSQTYLGLAAQTDTPSPGRVNVKELSISNVVSALAHATGGGVSAGLVTANGTVALAFNRASGIASLCLMPVTADKITVFSQISGGAKADSAALSVGLVTLGATVALAQNSSRSKALVKLNDTALSVRDISVLAGDSSRANEGIAEAKAWAGSVGLAVVGINFSIALNESDASALLDISGDAAASGDVAVGVCASSAAKSEAIISVPLSGIKIGSTNAIAFMTGHFSALLRMNGTLYVGGKLTIKTISGQNDGNLASARAGSESDLSFSLADAAVSVSYADAHISASAGLEGCGKLWAASAEILTDHHSRAVAQTPAARSITLVNALAVFAKAFSHDEISAFVRGTVSAPYSLSLRLKGAFTLRAQSSAAAEATGIAPSSYSLVAAGYGSVSAMIGSASAPQSVLAAVGDDVKIESDGALQISAFNASSAKAQMKRGYSISGVSIQLSTVPTDTVLKTRVTIGRGAYLDAKKGVLRIIAEDNAGASALVNGESCGILCSADIKYAINSATQDVLLLIDENAVLRAYGALLAQVSSTANLNADTYAENGGIFASGTLRAYNTLNRSIKLRVADGVTMFADFGHLELLASSGQNDLIVTKAHGNSAGLIALGTSEVRTSYNASADVLLGSGVSLCATFNDVRLTAEVGAGSVSTVGDYGSQGLGCSPRVRAYCTDLNLKAHIVVADSAAGSAVSIEGRNVFLRVYTGKMDASAYTSATVSGFAGSAYATSEINVQMDYSVVVNHAQIKAFDALYITAQSTPINAGTHLYAYAYTRITAFAGHIESSAFVKGSSNARVVLGKDVLLVAAFANIQADKFAGKVVTTADCTRRAIASADWYSGNEMVNASAARADASVVFHIADAAAGIVIDFYYDETGAVAERRVGMPDHLGRAVINEEGISLKDIPLSNYIPGRLKMPGADLSANKIYGQSYVSLIRVVNRTNLSLVLGEIDPYNEAYARPVINAAGYRYSAEDIRDEQPAIEIISYGLGDVTFTNKVNNERGSVCIEWRGEERGGAYTSNDVHLGSVRVAPIWAHRLTIQNARTIGRNASEPFEAYLSCLTLADGSIENARLFAGAAYDNYLSVTMAQIVGVSAYPAAVTREKVPGSLVIGGVEGKNVDLRLGTPFYMYYLAQTKAAMIVLPGMVEFTSDAFDLYKDGLSFDLETLERYWISAAYGSSGGETIELDVFTLPNNVRLYLVAQDGAGRRKGDFYRMTGENVDFDSTLFEYEYTGDKQLVILLRGLNDSKLNLSTGLLTAGETMPGSQSGVNVNVFLQYDKSTKTWKLGEGKVNVSVEYQLVRAVYDGSTWTKEICLIPPDAYFCSINRGSVKVDMYYLYHDMSLCASGSKKPWEYGENEQKLCFLGFRSDTHELYGVYMVPWVTYQILDLTDGGDDTYTYSLSDLLLKYGQSASVANAYKNLGLYIYTTRNRGQNRDFKTVYLYDTRTSSPLTQSLICDYHSGSAYDWRYGYDATLSGANGTAASLLYMTAHAWHKYKFPSYYYYAEFYLSVPNFNMLYILDMNASTNSFEIGGRNSAAYRELVPFVAHTYVDDSGKEYQMSFGSDTENSGGSSGGGYSLDIGDLHRVLNYKSFDGASIFLAPDASLRLYSEKDASGAKWYFVNKQLRVSAEGTIEYKPTAAQTHLYNPVISYYKHNAIEFRPINTLLDPLPPVHISGLIHLERLNVRLARDAKDVFYLYLNDKWTTEGVTAERDGLVTNVYYQANPSAAKVLIFKIDNSGVVRVHTSYDQKGALEYSVDSLGVVEWDKNDSLPPVTLNAVSGQYLALGESADGKIIAADTLTLRNSNFGLTGSILSPALSCGHLILTGNGESPVAVDQVIELKTGDITVRDYSAEGHTLNLTAQSGSVRLENVTVTGDFTLNAQGDVTITHFRETDGDILITAGGAVTTDGLTSLRGDTSISAGGHITMTNTDVHGLLILHSKEDGDISTDPPAADSPASARRTRLYDLATRTYLAGRFGANARLTVVNELQTPTLLTRLSLTIDQLLKRLNASSLLLAYSLSVSGDSLTGWTVGIYVGDKYEGLTLDVLSYEGGRWVRRSCVVRDGYVAFDAAECSFVCVAAPDGIL